MQQQASSSGAPSPRSTPPQDRQLGDERGRYGRKTVAEQAGELVGFVRGHRTVFGFIAVGVALGLLLLLVSGRPVQARDLRVGDCLYVPVSTSGDVDASRPIGTHEEVEQVLMSSGAETAPCDRSHGHEVSAIVDLNWEELPDAAPSSVFRDAVQPSCDAAFAGYVGRSAATSLYETFAAVPTVQEWDQGEKVAVCLIARIDGRWMDHPARNSGE